MAGREGGKAVRNMSRTYLLTIAAVLTCGVAAGIAQAEQMAPMPVELGEWYVGGGAGGEYFGGPTFKSNQLFKDDQMYSSDGGVTLKNPVGYLVVHQSDSTELIPEIHFGRALPYTFEGGIIRIEGSVSGSKRDMNKFTSAWFTADDGYFVPDNQDPPQQAETRAGAEFVPIDNVDNPDGSEATYVYFGDVSNNSFEYRETAVNADLAMLYDTRMGNWVFTRGASLNYGYLRQNIQNAFNIDYFDTAGAYYTRFDMVTQRIGFRFNYSAGYEFLPRTSVFTTGNLMLGALITKTDGAQSGPCLSTCTHPPADISDAPPGDRHIDQTDSNFAYSARIGLGLSTRLKWFRLTAHGGGGYVNTWATPRDSKGKFSITTSGAWGYFARATLDFAI
jgi:hypothetical protein